MPSTVTILFIILIVAIIGFCVLFVHYMNKIDRFYKNGGTLARYELGKCDSEGNPIDQ